MIDIEVQGFQSIERARLKVEGFSALVGRSNIGKSAIVRAVRCALTNPNGTSYVRHRRDCERLHRKNGKTCKCQATVRIRTEGFDLKWEKGDSVNRYTFNNDAPYDKPGPGMPDFLAQAGFAFVEAGDIGSIQISDQFAPIFLLNQSGAAIAEAISDVSRLDRINKATKLAEKDKRETSATRKVREGDVKDLEKQLSVYDGLDLALKLVGDADEALEAILEAQRKVEQLKHFYNLMISLAKEIRALQEAAKIDVADPEPLDETFAGVQESLRFQVSLDALADELRRLVRASKVEIDDPEPLDESFLSVQALARFDAELAHRQADVATAAGMGAELKDFPEEDPFETPFEELVRVETWIEHLQSHKDTLTAHERLPTEPTDTTQMEAGLDKLRAGAGLLSRLVPILPVMRDQDLRAKALAVEEATIETEINALGVCPTCTRPLKEKEKHTHAKTVLSLQD